MRSCDEILELISASLDGALTPEEQSELDEHLAGCPACGALYDDLRVLRAEVAALPELTAPEGFTARVMDAVAAESAQEQSDNVTPFPAARRRRSSVWKRWSACAAAAAVVILGAAALPGLTGGTGKDVLSTADTAVGYALMEKSAQECAPAEAEDVADQSAPGLTMESAGEDAMPSSGGTAYGAKNEPAAPQAAQDCVSAAPSYFALLTICRADAPKELTDFETAEIDGALYYVLPADDLRALAQELDLPLDEWRPDAETGLVQVIEP